VRDFALSQRADENEKSNDRDFNDGGARRTEESPDAIDDDIDDRSIFMRVLNRRLDHWHVTR
jgi:hypothetical protein